MKLRVETEKPVQLKTQEQGSLSLTQEMTIQPMPAIQIGTVETLPEGSEATASFSGDPRTPALNLGIPVGATGAQGPQGSSGERGPAGPAGSPGPEGQAGRDGVDGKDGVSAGFGTPSASVTDLEHGVPATVSISATGPNTAKVFSFSFGIPAGPKGDKGDPGIITLDPAPTPGSTNPAESGGIYSMFQEALGIVSGWLASKADASAIPTKVSDLTNDSGFLTLQTLPIYSGGVS